MSDAIARFDPHEAELRAGVEADGRHARIDFTCRDGAGFTGTVELHARVDLADGLDLEHALRASAQTQADLGSTLSLDQRRARGLGEIARTQLCLDLPAHDRGVDDDGTDDGSGDPAPFVRRPTRTVVLHVHLPRAAVAAHGNEPATVRHPATGEVLVLSEQVRTWCDGAAVVTVHPVIDLAEEVAVAGYDVPGHLDRLVRTRDRHCVFPHCTRPAQACDLDHVVPHAAGGLTASYNLAPLCRFHHRLKTHGRWRYAVVDTGRYRWTDPHGTTYEVDTRPRGGTIRGPDTHPPPQRT